MRRILIYAPGSEEGLRGLALANDLARARTGVEVLVVTEVPGEEPAKAEGVDRARLLDLRGANPERPLALEHLRGQRRRSLNTLFDRFQPRVLIALGTDEAPPQELRELLERAAALGRTTVFADQNPHHGRCRTGLGGAPKPNCPACRQQLDEALVQLDELS